jgi:hypothetical protein
MSAIPSAMRLEPKPEAINAYRRRCVTNATSSNPYPSRGTIKIPLDTAFPGSMLDTSQTQLSFTLGITNTNPFVDYFSLPKCGANAFIKELRIMVNGNAIEKNPRYGLAFEDAMNKMGINSEPYEFFSANQWCPTESKFHCNMIKPSMVDCMGNPMYRSTLFNDEQQIPQYFFGHANLDPDAIDNTSADKTPENDKILQINSSVFGNFNSNTLLTDTATKWSLGNNWGVSSGYIANTAAPYVETTVPGIYNTNGYTQCLGVLQTPLDVVLTEGLSFNRGNHTVYTPADWPFYQPGIAKPPPQFSQSRWQDISQFYANCKNIPIGMYKTWSSVTGNSTVNSISSTEYNGMTVFNQNQPEFIPTNSSNISYTQFRVTTPILSGILGLLTDKFFPDMLVAAGKMWIEIDLQPKEVALQLLMDPCRRIPGTIRDFVPYSGRLAGDTSKDVKPTSMADRHCILGRNLLLPLYTYTGTPPSLVFARNARICYSEGACIGEVFSGFGGYPSTVTGTAATSNIITQDGFYTDLDLNGLSSKAFSGGMTGVPIPQYCLSKTPWTQKSPQSVLGAYAKETEACYGTYLRSAVAQTRRTLTSTNCKDITTVYTSYDVDYTLTNVILYTEQIIVPDEIASQLLLSARNGAISYHTSFINATYNNAPTTESQNLLLTVTGASVNSVTFVFQSNVQLSGTEAFAYNSFASYNPWTKLDFNAGEKDVGGTYQLTNPLVTTNSLGLNLYLKIGNELIPRQAINDIPSFLMETQKGFQTLADYSIQLDMKTYLVPTYLTNSTVSYLQYDVLKDGFLSCFVEAKALDDQTLTGNPYLGIQGYGKPSVVTSGTTTYSISPIAARRQAPEKRTSNEYKDSHLGVLNLFKPLEGNFRMCFNLATFETQSSARCGTPIVNNQLFLQGDKMYFMSHKVDGQYPTVCVTAIYEQDAKIVFEQGGNCLSFM